MYLSGKRFGARKFAANFDDSALAEAIDYAHLRGVKVYVTVNTLVREDELPILAQYLVRLYELGADAILLQDLGAAALAKHLVPDLERHASTQMTIHNLPGALYAAQLGFKRVVLARELPLQEIKKWEPETRKAGVGMEVFVHGALCYSYSGQCLLSSAIGGRSGNRGMCAQPCRKSYVLMHGQKDQYGRPSGLEAAGQKESFILSTQDLCVYQHLDKLIHSPVQSLKIEGRMKSAQYVAIVTSIYRKAIDSIREGSWSPSPQDEMDLALAFNRGFTGGHLLGAKDIMGRGMSDNRGIHIGSVASYDPLRGEAAVRLCSSLLPEKGDGLVFQSPGQEMGLVVQRAQEMDGLVRLRTPDRVRPGARVYLTSSYALTRRSEEIAAKERPQIPIDITLSWMDGVPVAEGRLDSGEVATLKGSFSMQEAENSPLSSEQIESQMRRTGGTLFVVRDVKIDYPGGLFAPLGALNQLRRDLLNGLEKAMLERRRPADGLVKRAKELLQSFELPKSKACKRWKRPILTVYADCLDALKGAAEAGCDRIYFEPLTGKKGKDRAKEISGLLQEARKLSGEVELIWKWPRITKGDFLDLFLSLSTQIDVDGIMVENIGAAWAVQQEMPNMRIYGGSGLNVWNHLTAEALVPPFCHLTLSPELSSRQLTETISAVRAMPGLGGIPELELVVQGSQEVMVAEDCIPPRTQKKGQEEFWGLQDFKHIFPVSLDDDDRTHIFNSCETCLIDLMPDIFRMGLDGISLDARGRTGNYAREVIEAYQKAIELTAVDGSEGNEPLKEDLDKPSELQSGLVEFATCGESPNCPEGLAECFSESWKEKLQELKEKIRPLALGGITYGHFIKGLKDEISPTKRQNAGKPDGRPAKLKH